MGDFLQVQKYLRLQKSRQATVDEARNSNVPFDKYYGLQRSRPIQLINTFLQLPAFTFATGVLDSQYLPRLVFQYNVSMPSNFYILNPEGINLDLVNGCLTVKFREGQNVTRYLIGGLVTSVLGVRRNFNEQYTNQLIKANCCFEFWFIDQEQFTVEVGVRDPISIKTSILSVPAFAEQEEIDQNADAPLDWNTLGVNLPENLPYAQEDIAWLDNN